VTVTQVGYNGGMPRFSLKALFLWTALIAVEVFLLRQFMRPLREMSGGAIIALLLFWAFYGPTVGAVALVRSLKHDKWSDHRKIVIFIVAMISRFAVLFACLLLRPRV
jgi:hypothetical protein